LVLQIDPEIRDLIPPLSADEKALLEASIHAEGVREPIIAWQGTIVDGHHRYAICRRDAPENVIPYDVRPLKLETFGEVKTWVINNQLGRRTLSQFSRGELGLQLLEIEKAAARERQLAALRNRSASDGVESFPPQEAGKSRDKAASHVGISGRQLDKVAFVAQHADDETKAKLRSGETTVHKEHTRIKGEQRKAAAIEAVESKPEPMPDGPFDVLVADPPWLYGLRPDDPTHRSRCPYPPMSVDEIKALPVSDMADQKNAILWLWVTNAHLLDGSALAVIDAWGFEPKSMLTWLKDRLGTGHWLRGITEHCVMAVRGKPVHTLSNQSTLLEAPRREHSRKPEEFYGLVESLCPGSKVELFAREQREGWIAWGAEKGKFDEQG